MRFSSTLKFFQELHGKREKKSFNSPWITSKSLPASSRRSKSTIWLSRSKAKKSKIWLPILRTGKSLKKELCHLWSPRSPKTVSRWKKAWICAMTTFTKINVEIYMSERNPKSSSNYGRQHSLAFEQIKPLTKWTKRQPFIHKIVLQLMAWHFNSDQVRKFYTQSKSWQTFYDEDFTWNQFL